MRITWRGFRMLVFSVAVACGRLCAWLFGFIRVRGGVFGAWRGGCCGAFGGGFKAQFFAAGLSILLGLANSFV